MFRIFFSSFGLWGRNGSGATEVCRDDLRPQLLLRKRSLTFQGVWLFEYCSTELEHEAMAQR